MAAHSMYPAFLMLVAISLVSSEEVYVKSGENITDCSMKCSTTDIILQLCREGDDKCLLELKCEDMSLNKPDPRLHLNTSSGCWTLTDAQKNDSGVYIIRHHKRKENTSTASLPITVLDPVLISNITSNSSRLGQDIAVTVQFSGEEAAVTWEVDGRPLPDGYRLIDDNRTLLIPSAQIADDRRRLSVRITNPVSEETREYQLEITDPGPSPGEIAAHSPGEIAAYVVAVGIILSLVIFLSVKLKKRRTMDVERNGNNGLSEDLGLTSSSSETDPHREETGGNNLLLTWIHKIWRRLWKNPEYDQTPQRDEGAEMETSH